MASRSRKRTHIDADRLWDRIWLLTLIVVAILLWSGVIR